MTPAVKGIALGAATMAVVVTAANILVQYPINDWLTWGAFTYPISFLVTDLCNRGLGPARARQVVYAGFRGGGGALARACHAARSARLR